MMKTKIRLRYATAFILLAAIMTLSTTELLKLSTATAQGSQDTIQLSGFNTTKYHVPQNRYDDLSELQKKYYIDLGETVLIVDQNIGVTSAATQYEAYIMIANWISENSTYDSDRKSSHFDGILLSGKTICNGYAEMTYLLCCACGIDCWKVHGYTDPDGENYHAWNLLKLDGKLYWSDLTYYDYDTDANGIYLLSEELWRDRIATVMIHDATTVFKDSAEQFENDETKNTLRH